MVLIAQYRRALVAAFFAAVFAANAQAGHDYEEPVEFIAQQQAKKLIDIGEEVIFIDLRSGEEFGKGHLPGAKSIPIETLRDRWKEIPTSGRVVLYCACPPGQKDEMYAFTLLRQEKYRNITFLEAGFAEWAKRGLPVETATR
jgi:rhodanese-related sulfurtransferase